MYQEFIVEADAKGSKFKVKAFIGDAEDFGSLKRNGILSQVAMVKKSTPVQNVVKLLMLQQVLKQMLTILDMILTTSELFLAVKLKRFTLKY